MPVLLTFGGTPSVVNPLLASHTRRKTDVLDARLLARQAITGLWRASHLAFPAQIDFRVLWSEHTTAQRAALRAILRCNSICLRYGHTINANEPPSTSDSIIRMEYLAGGKLPKHPGTFLIPLSKRVGDTLSGCLQEHEKQKERQRNAKANASNISGNPTGPQEKAKLPAQSSLPPSNRFPESE